MLAFIVVNLLLAFTAECYADHVVYLFPGLNEEVNLTVSDCGAGDKWFVNSLEGLAKGPQVLYESSNELDGTWHCGKSETSFEVKTIDFKELPNITDIGENLIAIEHEEVEITCQFSYYHSRNKGPTHPLTVAWDSPVVVSENSSMVHKDTMKDDMGAFDLVSSVLKFSASRDYNGSSIVCHAMSENQRVKSSQTIQLIIDLAETSNGNVNGAMIYAAEVTMSFAIVAALCIVYWKSRRDDLRPRYWEEV